MGLAPSDFVPLDRRFDRASVRDTADYWVEILSDREKPRDWLWLRSQSRVIALLAQAGSGKTVEFQRQVDEARHNNRQAFFFRVERLCAGALEDAHETLECKSLFETWLSGKSEAEIFLDSVDEAKLPQSRAARPLSDAIRTLRQKIEANLDRVSIFVSCRSSEWFDDVEQRALQDLANAISDKAALQDRISVFNATFTPLDQPRVRKLAIAKRAEEAMITLIESEAIADIVTPLDAILYLDTFLEFRGTDSLRAKFASRGALLDSSVRRRLSEDGTETKRSQLEFTPALRAAQFLAFSSVAAQVTDIAVGGARKDCIDPTELLARGHAAISSDSIRQLLACSLFVPAGQGRVRFYRPEARAMLAAQWLRSRIAEGASQLRIASQFIKTVFGKPRVPSAYGSMLAWLSSYDPVIRRRMIAAGPEWVMEDGDPRSLALEDRIAALKRHVALGPNRFTGDWHFDVAELRRYATTDLEQQIVEELTKVQSDETANVLMLLSQAGRYPSAVPVLISILVDLAKPAGNRMYAIRALMACGKQHDLAKVALHYVLTGGPDPTASTEPFAGSRNDSVLLDLVMASYPESISATDAIALLSQLSGSNQIMTAKSFALWTAKIPTQDLEIWFVGLDELCFETPAPDYRPFRYDHPKMTRTAKTLLRGLSEVAARYIRERTAFNFNRDLLIYDRVSHIKNVGADYGSSRHGSPLPAAVAHNPIFRAHLFEHLAIVEKHKSTAFAYSDHVASAEYRAEGAAADRRWFLDRYRKSRGQAQSDYADAYLTMSRMYGRGYWQRLALLGQALFRRHPDWKSIKEAAISPIVAPFNRYWVRWRYQSFGDRRGFRARSARASAKFRLGVAVLRNWGIMRRGEAVGLLTRLVLSLEIQGPSEVQLVARYGRFLGGVLIDGTKALARNATPIDHGPSIYYSDILAHLGYAYIAHSDPTMPGVDPSMALRSALFHSTDWPEWAKSLSLASPEAWVAVTVPLILEDLTAIRSEGDADFRGRRLSSISHLDEELRAPLSASLLKAIESVQIVQARDVQPLARILRSNPDVERQVAPLASKRAREAWHEGAVSRAMAWMAEWLADDDAALSTLLAWMDAQPKLVGEGLSLYVRRYAERSSSAPLHMPALDLRYRFATIAYNTIDPNDDEPIREGVHSVTARDDLQRLRGSVGELLHAKYDDDERADLGRLISTYVEPISPEWAERWRNSYEKGAAKPVPWSNEEILKYGSDLTTAPTSGESLLDRVGELIADLEVELSNGEFDRRGLFSTSILEADYRAWLGHALDTRRRPWFSIVQEAETIDEARTDLRLELRGSSNAVVVIEIKLAHRWSYDDLVDKFRSQLVDKYLRTERVRHGIYLLVDLGKLPKGSMPDASKPTVGTVVKMLNGEASDLRANGGPVAVAQVFTITKSKRQAARHPGTKPRERKKLAAKPAKA